MSPAIHREDNAMTPLEYEALYHNLVVSLDGLGTTTVDVRRYQNNGDQYKTGRFEQYGNREALKHKDELYVQMSAEIMALDKAAAAKPRPSEITDRLTPMGDLIEQYGSEAIDIRAREMARATAAVGNRYNTASAVHLSNAAVLRRLVPKITDVHSGKGSPDEIAAVLHLVSRYKLYDLKMFAASPAAGVRDYCDKYIGLDCNGFVGNYARAICKAKVPNTEIVNYAQVKDRRTRIELVAPNDVLVWPDFSHIMVIHSIGPLSTGPDGKPARDCVVVESTPSNPSGTTKEGGLQNSTYSIRAVTNDVFLVERPKGGVRVSVYIAQLT
jgi:hypothetical protein